MLSRPMVALVGLTALAAATPVVPVDAVKARQAPPTNSREPCAEVAIILESDVNGTKPTRVPAKVAYECLNSIPLNATQAKAILFDIPLYVNWQSTLDVLKDPPAEYVEKVQPPVDILWGLEQISADIDSGTITNEYEFGWRLHTLIASTHDGHFTYILDVLGRVFLFGRPVPLVSVSEDGTKLPAVFAYDDVLGLHFDNLTYTPSPVVKIDGRDVNEYLEELSQQGSLQDRDALYNNLFYSLAQASLAGTGTATGGFTGGGRGRYVYPGASTTFEFANRSMYTMQNYARPMMNFTGVKNGKDVRDRIVYGSVSNAQPATIPEEVALPPPGYPVPVVPGPGNLINGFYIDASGYEDVAVLQVPNFVSSSAAEVPFQATSRRFLAKAFEDGKTKLIIDLQANGGGTILQGYDLFLQLFPQLDPYGANRFRYNVAVDLIGQAYSGFASQFPRDAVNSNGTVRMIQSSVFDYHTDHTVDGKPFESWKEKAGPNVVNGFHYTSLARWNLSDVYIPLQSGINLTGYGNTTRWEAKNIVLVTDGYCASTCAIFSEFMTNQGGVKTIAFGGRNNTNKIQAVGGVKGVNVYQWETIQSYTDNAIYLNRTFSETALKEYRYSLRVLDRAYAAAVNVRDGLRKGDDSGVALQFKYDEADCRLYFTPEMTVDVSAIWKAAADAQWSDSRRCIGNNGSYYPASTYGKRTDQIKTTALQPVRSKAHGVQALEQFEALKNTFTLETEYQPNGGNGFMQP